VKHFFVAKFDRLLFPFNVESESLIP